MRDSGGRMSPVGFNGIAPTGGPGDTEAEAKCYIAL